MAKQTITFDVFINCPFDEGYAPIFEALIFAVFACGFRARTTREVDDNGQARIDKLYTIIQQCRYGIHDISRVELDKKTKLPRFNMPLELGLFLGCKKYGGKVQAKKQVLILEKREYRYQKFISDIAAMDINCHRGRPDQAIIVTRNWLSNVSRRQSRSGMAIVTLYKEFRRELAKKAKKLKFDPRKLPYSDYEQFVTGWLNPE